MDGVDVIGRISSLVEGVEPNGFPLCDSLATAVGPDGVLYKVKLYQNRFHPASFYVQLPEDVSFSITTDENEVWYNGDGREGVRLGSFVEENRQ